jgi:TRAP-type mannitol/chloroaromatic compound transport system permease small subunit
MADDNNAPDVTGELPKAVRLAGRMRRVVEFFGRWGAWFAIPVIVVTCLDVILRKAKYVDDQGMTHSVVLWLRERGVMMFDSTILQELEWHFHAALFTLVLGYGVVYNTHVRIDLIRDTIAFRKKAWLELAGLTFFMIPYCAIVIYFAFDYVHSSFMVSEGSASTVGLGHRWVIKTTLVIGLLVAVMSGLAAWLQVATILWGPKDLRFPLMTLDWPETEQKIEGKTRVKLEDEYGLRLSDPVLLGDSPPSQGPPGGSGPPRAREEPAVAPTRSR